MIALGQLPYQDMGFECSGTVIRVGKKVEDFKVGDLVCGITQRAFASVVRTQQFLISHIPNGMDCKTAASIPLVFCTALFSLRHVARLQRGESILIHCAAGGVGQAAVMLARRIGAEIYITVSSPEKRSLVADLYNVSEDHIFSSRDTTFEPGIKRMTNGAGVDVVLNCLAGEALQASWNCLANFGRFIEIGKRDLVQNNRLEMENFTKSVTFSAVDLALLVVQKPHVVHELMTEIVGMFSCGSISSVSPLNLYTMSGIQDAMRSMQAGKHIGKVIIESKEDDVVLVRHPNPASHAVGLLIRTLGGRTSYSQKNCSPQLRLPYHRRHRRYWSIDNSLVGETGRENCNSRLSEWQRKLCSPDAYRRDRKSQGWCKSTGDQMRCPDSRAGTNFGGFVQPNNAHPWYHSWCHGPPRYAVRKIDMGELG